MATEAAVLTGTTPSVGAPSTPEVGSPSPSETTLGTSVELETQETAAPEAGETESGTEAGTAEDGRLLPRHIRALKDSDPAAFKAAKAQFFEHRAFKEHFPTTQEAQQARELLDQIGGEEGWSELQERQAQQDEFNKQYSSNDPEANRAFVKGLLTDDPASFRRIVPLALDEFHRSSPQEYSRVMSRIISNTLNMAFDNLGVRRVLASIGQKFTTANIPVPEEVAALTNWASRFEEIANARSGMDEEREAFEREKQGWQSEQQKKESETLTKQYHSETRVDSQRAVKRHLSQVLKDNLPDGESMTDLIEHVERRIASMAAKDKNFVRQRNQCLQRKDIQRAKKLVLNKINQLLPEAAKRELRLYGVGKAAPAPKPGVTPPAQPTPAGVIRLGKMPQPSEIDYRRSAGLIMKGEAILKSGKHVKWE